MSRLRTPAVEIEFGGRTRKLSYDFNAQAEIEDQKLTWSASGEKVPRMKMTRAVLWALLLAETLDRNGSPTKDVFDKEGQLLQSGTLSLFEVGEIISAMESEQVEALAGNIAKAMGIAMPDEQKDPPPVAAILPLSNNSETSPATTST